MTADGYIITNCHVIEDGDTPQVLLQNDDSYQAAVIGSDETSDLAVLKIDADGLTPAEFGDSDALQVGDAVVAIGDPLGTQLRGTMTDGIISAINRDLAFDGRTLTLLQTNAALNSGNSGGPLINMQGQGHRHQYHEALRHLFRHGGRGVGLCHSDLDGQAHRR